MSDADRLRELIRIWKSDIDMMTKRQPGLPEWKRRNNQAWVDNAREELRSMRKELEAIELPSLLRPPFPYVEEW